MRKIGKLVLMVHTTKCCFYSGFLLKEPFLFPKRKKIELLREDKETRLFLTLDKSIQSQSYKMFQQNISLFSKLHFYFLSTLSRKLANFLLIAFCVSSFCIDDPLLKETSSESRGELLSRYIN